MDYSREGLGQAIRELREAHTPKLSQEQLGRKAGYRAGAGVSMSRIENGVTRPGPRRLEGIANALGLTVHELEIRGAERSPDRDGQRAPRLREAGSGDAQSGIEVKEGVTEPTKDRMRRIQGEFDRRQSRAVMKARAFNAVHDSARDDFFMQLVRTAATITGLPRAPAQPPVPAVTASNPDRLSPTDEAALRRQVAAHGISVTLATGAGAAAAGEETNQESAYDAVVAAALLTPIPATPAHQDRQSAATVRATRALLGGGTIGGGRTGIRGGTLLLTGFLATAASPLLTAGALAWMARRSRRQNDQLRIELDQAEANLAETQPGFDAVMDILTRATDILGYIAVHAAHAQHRWHAQLPAGLIRWPDLSRDQQRQYQAFVEVAACEVLVDSMNMTELLASHGQQQARLIQVADDILTLAKQHVELLV